MQLFYSKDILSSLSLDLNESKHCISVLRKKINDIIFVTDGEGYLYKCEIKSFQNKVFSRGLKKNAPPPRQSTSTMVEYFYLSKETGKNV